MNYSRSQSSGAGAHQLHPSENYSAETPAAAGPIATSAGAGTGIGTLQTDPKPVPSDFPPVVYLPCAESVSNPEAARVDMRQTRDGRTALLAYSALDRLHTCCGPDQAWILVPTANLARLQVARPFQLLLLDVVIPPERRRKYS